MPFLKDLNPVQQEAVKAANGPVMIIAGAGSGKTRVLTYRIAHLVSCKVPPHQILALTFTNKAANEMKERILKLVGKGANDLWMGTFHSIFARILRKEAESVGFTRSFTIYDSDDSLSAIKKCMEKVNLSQQQINPQLIRSRISGAKNQLVTSKAYSDLAKDFIDEKVGIVYEEYERALHRSNAMDFDDLLVKPIDLFRRHPNILEKYHHRFKFVLVDEFQDTNRAQYEMIKLLAQKHRNICVVGDDAQSIYAFRGADIRNILDFTKDYSDCQTFRLEQNYRSTKSILAVADTLIKYNADQLRKNLWTANQQGEPVVLIDCPDDRDEGYQITRAIQEEILDNKLSLKDFAILYRTNAQSRSIEDVLRRSGIPYIIVGGTRFYERKEIKDVLAYLRLLVNPQDDQSFLRAVNYPARGIGDTSLEYLRKYADDNRLTLFQAVFSLDKVAGLQERAKKNLAQFKTFVEKYASLKAQMSLSELARSMVDELGILKSFKEEGTPESMGRWENVHELLSAISEFGDEHPDGTLEAFLEEVTLVSDIDMWEGTRNTVTLMTLHASKGLEFPIVFIAGLEEGLLPFYSTTIERTELEEERRLLYVGITRAKSKLYLSKARLRYRFGEVMFTSPSRFISEIGEDKLRILESATARKVLDETSFAQGRNGNKHRPSQKKPVHKEPFLSDDAPNYEDESQEVFEIKQGSWVQHEMFGKGKVIRISGEGESAKAVVHFDDYGVKNLILKFARLRLT
ncbi:MAG: UvrD-helicase domain-containing protein [Ignavibacteriales bacterium]|nr:UvrD-helicase domain-containing protein [Ignavibacteriales bacterium]